MQWPVQVALGSVITVALTLVAAYLVYRFKSRKAVAIEIVAETMVEGPIGTIVVTNHGRTPIVLSEVNAYLPAEQILPELPLLPPQFRKPRFLAIRKRMHTHGSQNDSCAATAEKLLCEGAAKATFMPPTETMKVGPHEKAAYPIRHRMVKSYGPTLELPDVLTLVPSCKLSGQEQEIWGRAVIVYRKQGEDCNWIVIG